MSEAPGQDERVSDGTQPYTGWPASLQAEKQPQARKRKRRSLPHTPMISITSLTDCVTLLLVYLLKTFTTSPIEVKEPSIKLPVSSIKEPIEEATILMVTGTESTTILEGRTVVTKVVPRIIVEGRPVLELDPATYRIRDADKQNGYIVTALLAALKKEKERQEMTSQLTGKEFTGKVIILADKQTPYRVLTDLLVTCGQAGFGDFRFATIKTD